MLLGKPYLIQIWHCHLQYHELFMELTEELVQQLKAIHVTA